VADSKKNKESSDRFRITATLKIDGESYLLTKVRMLNVDNGIPTVECYIIPEGIGETPNREDERASGDVGYFLEQNNKLQHLKGGARKKTSFTLKVEPDIRNVVDKTDTYEVKLNNWVVVDAGISNLSFDSAFASAIIVLQHPMYLYDRMPLGLLTEYKPVKNREDKELAANLLDGCIKGINTFIDNHDPAEAKPANSQSGGDAGKELKKMDEERVADLRKMMKTINDVIIWEEPDAKEKKAPFPFSFIFTFKQYAKKLFTKPSIFYNNTIFGSLKQALCPMYLSITGKFTDGPMSLSYRNPWGEIDYEVNVSDLNAISLPAINTPVEAVVLQGKKRFGSIYSLLSNFADTASGMALKRTDAASGYFEHFEKLDGTVIYTKPPEWLSGYLMSTVRRKNGKRNQYTGISEPKESVFVTATKEHSENFNKMLKRMAKDIFYDAFYRGSRASLVCRFRPTVSERKGDSASDGFQSKEVRPGVVMALVEDARGRSRFRRADGTAGTDNNTSRKERLRMYVTHVIHTIDVNAGTAKTTIAGSHARGPDGVKSPTTGALIVKTRKLAIYDESEKVE